MDVFFFGILLVLILHNLVNAENCTFRAPCACDTQDFKVNLYPLRNLRKHPLYVKDHDLKFYLNPCGKSVLVPACKKNLGYSASGCMKIGSRVYGIARTLGYTAHGDPETNEVTFTYSYGERTTNLRVECSPDVKTLAYEGEKPMKTYNFVLYTQYACKDFHNSGKGTTVGSFYTFLFLVIIGVLVYFLGGILYMKFYKKKEGLDVIPHRNFWLKIPMMVKGCCASSPGPNKNKNDGTYEKI